MAARREATARAPLRRGRPLYRAGPAHYPPHPLDVCAGMTGRAAGRSPMVVVDCGQTVVRYTVPSSSAVMASALSKMLAGGALEGAARIAGHASTRTTQLYHRLPDEVSLDEIERIHI